MAEQEARRNLSLFMTALDYGTNFELTALYTYFYMRKINPNVFKPLSVQFSVATPCIHNW